MEKVFKKALAGLLCCALLIGVLPQILTSPKASAAEAKTPFVATETTDWKYSDVNEDPAAGSEDPTVWTQASYDDAAWKTAKGSFGAKKGAIASLGEQTLPDGTVVDCTPTTLLNQYIDGTKDDIPTFFFRTHFSVDQASSLTSLKGVLLYDDAAIVYINGQKVAAFDEPEGGFESNMSYGGSNASDPKLGVFTLKAEDIAKYLKDGDNTLAVELHQGRASSSDIYFDFISLAEVTDEPTAQPDKVKNISLGVGADETQRNFAWFSTSDKEAWVEIAKGTAEADQMPAEAQRVAAVVSPASEEGYYSCQATVSVEPGTSYIYRVGNDDAWSDIYTTATGDADQSFSFLLAGDPQIGAGSTASDIEGWKDTMDKSAQWFPEAEFLISAGDQVNSNSNTAQYDGYFAPSQTTSLPQATNIGNHDSGSDLYNQHFNMPNVDQDSGWIGAGKAGGDYWYMYKGVLFMSINSNDTSTSEHKAFLEKVVAEQGDKAAWKVVTFHHSVYSTASHESDGDIIARREELPPIFSELGIDVVLMGHDHVYTRTYMMQGTTPVIPEDGQVPASVTNPEKGQVLYLTANSASGSKFYSIHNKDFPYAAVKNQENTPNITKIDVSAGSFTMTTYRTADQSVVDSFTINHTDKTALQEKLDAAKALNKDEYTAESYAVLEAVMGEAQAVLDNDQASQDDIDAQSAVLDAAMNALVKKTDGSQTGDQTPGQNGSAGSSQGTGNTAGTNTTGTNTAANPVTGDASAMATGAVAVLVALAVLAIIVKQRKFGHR